MSDLSWLDAAVDAAAKNIIPWQNQYAVPNWQQKLTQLTPQEERQFQQWAAQTKAPITDDYDMRGYWKNGPSGTKINSNDGLPHFPDTYKTPLHHSFSGESIYARKDISTPTWNDKDQLIAPNGAVLYDERAQNNEH